MKDVLKIILDRCTEVGDCWMWAQGVGSTGYPVTRILGKQVLVRRAAVEASGRVILRGYCVRSICGHRTCCNPDHLRLATHSEVISAAYRDGNRSSAREYLRRRRNAIRQGLTKLTMDDARAIRASNETMRELAKRYGVHKSTIRDIRAANTWREAAPMSSVWSGARAAA